MAESSPFSPYDKTFLLTTSALNCVPTTGSTVAGSTANPPAGTVYCFRIRNLLGTVAYFTFGGNNGITSVGAPTAGNPSANTIGMLPNSVETFRLTGPWLIAGTANAFEVTPGEGV